MRRGQPRGWPFRLANQRLGDTRSTSSSVVSQFLLTATDGQVAGGGGVDKFRIKIMNGSTVVYDNVLDSGASDDIDNSRPIDIGGGSITIHSK